MISWLYIGFGLIVLAAGGCQNKHPQPTFPASGVIKWSDGQPATELTLATVTLSGKGGEGPKIPVNPRGQVRTDGTFVLETYDSGNGAPAGKYRASITLSFTSRDKDGPRPSVVMDPRFESYQTSGLEVTITPEQNQLQLTVQRAKH